MYKKVSSNMDFTQRELDIIKFWNENNIFKKALAKNVGAETFTFYEGPPTANGKPHIGHILTRVIKDIIPRYKTMKGYNVARKAGWDTHGLPVELEVEKMLGMDGKQDIEKYGIEPFIKKCKESVWKYKGEWEKMSDRVAFWADMEHPYITYDDNYIESVWWSIKQIANKNLIYKGHKVVPYCPRCGTALSSHEVSQGYKTVKDKSLTAKFKVVGQDNTYLLAWTTTPWTLPSNVALCVNAKEKYAIVLWKGDKYILAEALVKSNFKDEEVEILSTCYGKDLEGTEYEALYNCNSTKKKAYYVVSDSYVTLTDGTGIVHIAPAFGEDDANVGRKFDLPFIQMVDDKGHLLEGIGEISGKFIKDADPLVIKDLSTRKLLFDVIEFEHSYPFCWRCDTPLMYYARASWFIKMTSLREKLLKNNNSINWMPATIKSGRMGNFLENVIDWSISRERYWGTPLPIWVCDECNHLKFIGSKEELRKEGNLDHDVELHKPYIDDVKIKCEKCGAIMHRTPEVLDCWYDSGSMPFAQQHYPFENQNVFKEQYPANFISEAVDQTRGWFYTLLAVSTAVFDQAPFKNCIVLGHVNDANGIKMSKHKGNVVDPWSVLDKQGADAVRWYFYTGSSLWLPSRFSAENVEECQRKFMGTLLNTYAFYVLYADIDKFNPYNYDINKAELSLMDKWLLSKLNSLIDYVDKGLEEYKITETARAIQDFVDQLSNWYVRRSRERYWAKGMENDKIAAYLTLHHTLVALAKLLAPYIPFLTEEIYQNLVIGFDKNAPQSVHLCDFPQCDKKRIDKKLEEEMDFVLKVVLLGRAARAKSNVKNRQPLAKIFVKSDKEYKSKDVFEIIEGELNVQSMEIIHNDDSFVNYEVKPQLKTLGPKYGQVLSKIKEYLATCDTKNLVKTIEEKQKIDLDLQGSKVELTKEDLLISVTSATGFAVEVDRDITVILDTNLSDDLIELGVAREIVSKVQTMRKDSGFEVVDHIKVDISGSDFVVNVCKKYNKEISADVLSDLTTAEAKKYKFAKEVDINGNNVVISIEKI